VAALRRRRATAWKGEDDVYQQLVLFKEYHNVVLVHTSVCQGLPIAETTNGGSAKVWWPWTLAMAAGLTDHVWSLKEVRLYRVPPWPQPQTVSKQAGVDARSVGGLRVLRCRSRDRDGGLKTGYEYRSSADCSRSEAV
jgi:hypothetical protein